jgi:hypothetical protein
MSLGGVEKSIERATRSEGFRLKKTMESSVKGGQMGWGSVSPFTKATRKRYKTGPPGVWFRQFVRYGVGRDMRGDLTLKVGVFNPGPDIRGAKVRPLSKMIVGAAERFVSGSKQTVTQRVQRARIKKYLRAKHIEYASLSPGRKKSLRKRMLKAGVFMKIGSVIKVPARTVDKFVRGQEGTIYRNIGNLFHKALRGERWAKDWWQK